MTTPRSAIEAVFREEHGLVLAGLIRYTGDIQLAEDSLQDACVAALGAWRDELPANPAAWLSTTAKRKAIDRVRRSKTLETKYPKLVERSDIEPPDFDDTEAIDDERLRLIFTCCHPALAPEARVALTLRTVAGLTTPEIARAFLVTESTMGQRISRAKRKIREAGIPYRVPGPEEVGERLPAVLSVVYLVFNEGYAASHGDSHIRTSLVDEAIHLGGVLLDLLPDEPEVIGLVCLMEFHAARSTARLDASGDLVLLPDQDRSMWDHARIERAEALLDEAVELRQPGPYQLQAALAAVHATAPSADETDWKQIVALYQALRAYADTETIRLNQAVAISMTGDRDRALSIMDSLTGLDSYPYLHAARARLLEDDGRIDEARECYERALILTSADAEQRYLRKRLDQLA